MHESFSERVRSFYFSRDYTANAISPFELKRFAGDTGSDKKQRGRGEGEGEGGGGEVAGSIAILFDFEPHCRMSSRC